jgi:hypothetical protein
LNKIARPQRIQTRSTLWYCNKTPQRKSKFADLSEKNIKNMQQSPAESKTKGVLQQIIKNLNLNKIGRVFGLFKF